jgi:Family of unknown function (DUF6064)
MQIPFTAEQFFYVFRLYNSTVWPAQVLPLALAVLAVIFIALRRHRSLNPNQAPMTIPPYSSNQ